ncbi:MAG: PAS domain-containing sensor histidine kinase [Patescibacteria group bacterium]
MIIAFFTTIIFGIIAILLSIEADKKKKLLLNEAAIQKDKIQKISILKDIQDKTAYTLTIEKAIDVVMGNLRSLFPYSTASYMIILDKNLIFRTYAEEGVSSTYIKNVKESMLSSLSELSDIAPEKIDERLYGVSLNDSNSQSFSSSFHIPLVVNNNVVALIHLSSTKQGLYKNKDMEILYQILEQVGNSLSTLQRLIEGEKSIFVSLINGVGDGIFMIDNKNNLLITNNAFRKMLSIDKPNINFLDIVNMFPAKLDLATKLNDVFSNKKTAIEKGIKIKEVIVNIFIAPLENNRAAVVLHDVTEEAKIASLKEEFMHVIIHELRAPITTIKDASELILSTHHTLEEDKKMKFLEIIHNQSKMILNQVGSILDTAKLDAGRFTIEKTEGDLGRVIKEEVEAFIPQAERKQISLSFNIINPLPLIYFDAIRMSQVINNLVSNSLKFTPIGGIVKVEADYKPAPPDLNSSYQKDKFLSLEKYIILSVSDNGIGIDKEQQKYLFSKFTQAKNTPEKLTKLGTGLGLYLVKGIVGAHGGRVWVKSEPQQGTTITFILPAHLPHVNISKDDPQNPASTFPRALN